MPSKKMSKKAKDKQLEREKTFLHMIARGIILMTLVVFPLFIGSSKYVSLSWEKALFFWILALASGIVFLLFYTVYFSDGGRPKENILRSLSPVDWAVLAYFLIATLSNILSPHPDVVWLGMTERYDGWFTTAGVVLIYFIISRWYKPKLTDAVFFAASSILVCLIGVLQFFSMDIFNLFPYERFPQYTSLTIFFRTTLGNVNVLSAYTCMTIVLFGVLYAKSQGRLRFLFLFASVFNFWLLHIAGAGADAGKVSVLGVMVVLIPCWIAQRETFGRILFLSSLWGFVFMLYNWILLYRPLSAWGDVPADLVSPIPVLYVFILSVAGVMLSALLIFFKPSIWLPEKNAFRIGCMVLLVMIAGLLGIIEIAGANLPAENPVFQAREVLHGNIQDDFGSNRGFVWRKSIEASFNQPILGTGSDTFYYALGKETQSEAVERYGVIFDKAHNDFLQNLLCHGLPGLLAYLSILIGLIVKAFKKIAKDGFLLAIMAAVGAYMIQGFFGVNTTIVMPIFWVFLAMAAGHLYQSEPVAIQRTVS